MDSVLVVCVKLICCQFPIVYLDITILNLPKGQINYFDYYIQIKAWEFLLFARPRFEAFALPGIVERATQRPHAGYVYTNMLHAGKA